MHQIELKLFRPVAQDPLHPYNLWFPAKTLRRNDVHSTITITPRWMRVTTNDLLRDASLKRSAGKWRGGPIWARLPLPVVSQAAKTPAQETDHDRTSSEPCN